MAGYLVTYDAPRALVICCITPAYQDAELPGLIRNLSVAVDAARVVGPLRALWDNRAGRVLVPETAGAVRAILIDPAAAQDRVAVLVPDSLSKARSRPSMDANSELFASENAALTWLGIGRVAAAA